MIVSPADLRTLGADYLAGLISIHDLDSALGHLAELDIDDVELREIVGHLSLLLAERSVGHLDAGDLAAEISRVLAVVTPTALYRITPPDGPVTGASTRVLRLVVRIQSWIRITAVPQASGTSTGTGYGLPAGNPA